MSVGSECWAIRDNVHGASCGFPPRDTKYCAFVLLLRHFSHFEIRTGNRKCTNSGMQKRFRSQSKKFRRQGKVLTSLLQLTKFGSTDMFRLPITVAWILVVRVARRGSYLQISTTLLPTFRHFRPPSWIYWQHFSRPFGTRPSRPAYPDSTFRHVRRFITECHHFTTIWRILTEPDRSQRVSNNKSYEFVDSWWRVEMISEMSTTVQKCRCPSRNVMKSRWFVTYPFQNQNRKN